MRRDTTVNKLGEKLNVDPIELLRMISGKTAGRLYGFDPGRTLGLNWKKGTIDYEGSCDSKGKTALPGKLEGTYL